MRPEMGHIGEVCVHMVGSPVEHIDKSDTAVGRYPVCGVYLL